MLYPNDPITEEYIAAKKKQKEMNESMFNLLMLLTKLNVWPEVKYRGKTYPILGSIPAFKKFYQDRTRNGR